jgi:Transglycosylase SLT domain
VRQHAVVGCVCAAAVALAASSVRGQQQPLPEPAGAARSELIYFPGRAAPVRVVRGGAAPMPVRPPARPALPALALPPACGNPSDKACGNVDIVSFGDGLGETVRVIRGTAATAVSQPATGQPEERTETIAFADPLLAPVTVVRGGIAPNRDIGLFAPANGGELDRIAFAVEGVESGHGTNPRMWRPEESGPQGPMQVSAAAAGDVGGGDRFDERQNRLLGRAFLAHMYQRYGNWPDALAAYNWGPAHLDNWIAAGRPEAKLPPETARYIEMVLRDALVRRVRM